jgi:Fis family transcriptional regulator
MMLSACEKPLLEWVMAKTRNNQSLASEWLGVNRATLRKKLQQYDLL